MMYFVIEIQKWKDGTWHNIVTQHESRMEAESTYYTILAASAIKEEPRNGAAILDGNGNVIMSYVYQHGEWEGYKDVTEEIV